MGKRKRNTHLDSTQLPVTSLEFLQKKTEDLPPHDQFLHRYFRLRSGGGVVGTSRAMPMMSLKKCQILNLINCWMSKSVDGKIKLERNSITITLQRQRKERK